MMQGRRYSNRQEQWYAYDHIATALGNIDLSNSSALQIVVLARSVRQMLVNGQFHQARNQHKRSG